ncbi:MAG: ABC transporter permease [Planctomycetota bacterium]|nr:ABC transporter permease [Planctomycetota bacterium]MEC9157527.1 ABC transporter permease [Planctomycetota bacterium]
MNGLLGIFLKELRTTFFTAAGWVTLAIGSLLLAIIFITLCLLPGGPATLQPLLKLAAWVLMLVAPAFAMRAFSEERRQGTWELLLSSPSGLGTVVVGKFLALLVQLGLLGIPIVACGLVLEFYSRPDWGEIGCGLLGLLLAGSAWLALGMLASTLTESQLVSYLLALFTSLVVVLCARMIPGLVDPAWSTLLFGLDPTRRADDFAIGLLDTANVVYFLAVIVGLLLLTRLGSSGFAAGRASRVDMLRSGFLELFGVVALVVAAVGLFDQDRLRHTFDLTRTRAYALAPSTIRMLESLPGPDGGWSITVLAVDEQNDPAVLRQVDEVLQRFDQASPRLVARRIDPLDPGSLLEFDALLGRLDEAYAEEITAYEAALDAGQLAYEGLREFAIRQLPVLRGVLAELEPGTSSTVELTEMARALTRLTADGEELERYVGELLATSGARPLPDYEGARTGLQTTCGFWSEQLAATAELLRDWSTDSSFAPGTRVFARNQRPAYMEVAVELARAADALAQLPPLELSEAARALQAGEAAIVLSPSSGAAVVPAWQLFPRSTTEASDGTVRIDRRFRGEEVLAGAIRSLDLEERPWVVLVHGEDRRMLRPSEQGSDFYALADALRAARHDVVEWNVNTSDRPIPPAGTRPVWVVLPPLQRSGLEVSPTERSLLSATRTLLRERQPVLLSVSRSILPLLGVEDPWAGIAQELGVEALTSKLVLERLPVDEETFETRQWTRLPQPDPGTRHPVSSAVGTQALVILQPVGLAPRETPSVRTLWSIQPSPNRWLEPEWNMEVVDRRESIPPDLRFDEPLPVVVAVENEPPGSDSPHRVMVVGGSGWLLSTVADLSRSMGGDRVVLEAPGNRGFILAATAWLSGLDELVAAGSGVSEVSRLTGLSEVQRTVIGIVLILVLPLLILCLGGVIVLNRRRG